MLYEFLETNRQQILYLAEEKSLKLAGHLQSSDLLKQGLPLFYEYLIEYLKSADGIDKETLLRGAAEHGKELLRLHYSLSHVVHSYGAMCQAITELAQDKKAGIKSHEFNDLNLCLDIAIASAVSEYQFCSVQASEAREIQHLGSLVHELRNALSSATIAQEMIKQGLVGTGGSTARVLEDNLSRMRELIDRSLSDVRMRADPVVHVDRFQLNIMVDQILITAQRDGREKKQILSSDVSPDIQLNTDRQLLLSVIANLVQNSIKYSREGSQIFVRAIAHSDHTMIEVEDECGGIAPALLKTIFSPFTSGSERSGLGLGLTIVQRAVSLLQGKISVRNKPGLGCVFVVQIPHEIGPVTKNPAVSGEASAQPGSAKGPAK